MRLRSKVVDRVRSLRKIMTRLVPGTFALIAPVQPVLHRVYCRNKTIPNAPEHYETRQNMSFGSYGFNRVHSLRKIRRDFVAQTFALIAQV